MKTLWILVSTIIASIFLFSHSVCAETQTSVLAQAVKADPYYFSEGGLGIDILNLYQQLLTPYLTSQTPANANETEILKLYEKATENITSSVIVNDNNRAKSYVVHFLGTQEKEHVFTTFSLFQPLLVKNPLTPSGMQTYRVGFILTSLPSKDKKWFYDSIISDYINPNQVPQPVDANIDVSTGDGTILQTYQYHHCTVIEYVPYLDEELGLLKFTKQLKAEFRERTIFSCDGFHVDFNLHKQTSSLALSSASSDNFIPSQNDTLQKYIVTFSSSNFGKGITYYTFGKFTPVDRKKIQFPGVEDLISLPVNLIGGSPKFVLEDLPSKDKAEYYNFLYKYINPGRYANAEPADVTVDLVNGDGTVFESWKYKQCYATDYSVYRQELTFVWKFTQSHGPEIRDKALFSCSGLAVDFLPSTMPKYQEMNMKLYVPSDNDRVQVFTVHLSGGVFGSSTIDYTFPKFQPLSAASPLTPSGFELYNIGFYVESLPYKDEETLYQIIGKYVNPGSEPQRFDASVNLVDGDGSVLQTWKYTKCSVAAYTPFLNEIVIVNTFTGTFHSEIRDRTVFQCNGISIEGQKPTTNQINTIQPIDFVPKDNDRALSFGVTMSNGDFQTPQTFSTFAMFAPQFTNTGKSTPFQIKSTGFTLTDLPSLDKASLGRQLLYRYINPTEKPNLFDVSVDVITGDGTKLQTWKYQKCSLVQYKTYLMDSILLYTINGKPFVSEIRESWQFACGGFSLEFGGNTEVKQSIPSYDERAVAYIVTGYGGEMTSTHTTGLVNAFDTNGSQQFQMLSLPNKYGTNAYPIVSQYVNPGTKPELFDITTNMVTGNGTVLYSVMYKKCFASGYAIFRDSNMANLKFTISLKSEIREQADLSCSGLGLIVLPQKETASEISKSFGAAIGVGLFPQVQKASSNEGLLACNEGYQLMVRPPNYNTVCVKTPHVSNFIDRGWIFAPVDNKQLSGKIMPIIPTSKERAMSYRVQFQGTEIKTQTFDTFSNFSPIDQIFINPKPAYQLMGQQPMFALTSLPSKDKQPFYNLVSMYINPGIKPNPFDVKIDVLAGDNSTLQTWDFQKCTIIDYMPFLNQNVLQYKFHMKWQSEIQDISTFACSGLSLK